MSLSNLHGRVLEYILVLGIKEGFKQNVIFSEQTLISNERDQRKLEEINKSVLNHFISSSPKIVKQISKEFTKEETILLNRLSDDEGRKGDVSDISLSSSEKTLNISIKNNHLAIKHQRPGPTFKHLGIKNNIDINLFKNEYKRINNSFFDKSNQIVPDVKNYSQVESIKFDYLYEPICDLVSNLINKYPNQGRVYQNFLISVVDFKKIVLFDDRFEIHSYDNIPPSNFMESYVKDKNYVYVDFKNDIILKMRLHTASSEITRTGSLKFDTQIHHLDIPKKIFKL